MIISIETTYSILHNNNSYQKTHYFTVSSNFRFFIVSLPQTTEAAQLDT